MSFAPYAPSGPWVSVDPGDRNVGVACWIRDKCTRAHETDPDAFVDWLVESVSLTDPLRLVVLERWTLYPHMTAQFAGSEFMTAQLIGAIRHICRRAGVPLVMQAAHSGNAKALAKIAEFRPPQRPLRAWTSYGQGPHAKDAEAHGIHFLRMKQKATTGW